MGTRTTLYSADRETVVSFLEAADVNFNAQEPLDLDKAAPILSYLIGTDPGKRLLCSSDCLELEDAVLRGFLPEDVAMFLRRMQLAAVSQKLDESDWQAEIAGNIYPFTRDDTKKDSIGYIDEYAQSLEIYMARLVDDGRGMITVEA